MFGISLLTAPPELGGVFLGDLTDALTNVQLAWNEHGDLSCTAEIVQPRWIGPIYDNPNTWIRVAYAGEPIWDGRIEQPGMVLRSDVFSGRLTAYGAQRCLSDTRYTALWSDTSTARWIETTRPDVSSSYNDRFELDNNNRLRMGVRTGETYGTTTISKRAYWRYQIPDRSSRQITRIAWTYTLTGTDTAWVIGALNSALSTIWGTVASIAGTVGPTAITQTFTGTNDVYALLSRNAADAAYGGATGSTEAIFTSIRVTTATPPITADLIIDDLIAAISALNPLQLSSSTARVQSPGIDLTDAIYEDANPVDVLNRLADLGDSSSPPRKFVWRIARGNILEFVPDGTDAQAWYLDDGEVDLERSLDDLRNSVYAVYRDANGRTLRTTTSADTESVTQYSLTRRAHVASQSTSSLQAEVERDADLEDGRQPLARAGLRATRIRQANGAIAPAWRVRPGDTVTLAIPTPGVSTAVDRTRVQRIREVQLDLTTGMTTLVPADPPSTLAFVLTRRERRI